MSCNSGENILRNIEKVVNRSEKVQIKYWKVMNSTKVISIPKHSLKAVDWTLITDISK